MITPVNRRELLVLTAGALAAASGGLEALAAPRVAGKRKRALLVAVQGYLRANDPDSAKLLHTLPDVEMLEKVLRAKGFTEVIVLKTEQATTKKRISEALARFLADSQDDDVLYFHYSGHGSQIVQGETPLDWDQTLVPFDYQTRSHAGDIRDKELAQLLADGLKNKTPAAFLLTFDSCHSGTITRGEGGASRSYTRDMPADHVPNAALETQRAQKQPGLISPDVIGKMKFTVISACRSDESDHETLDDDNKPVGSLSYAVSKALANANEKTTYRDLFERITDIMRSKGVAQTPVMEGLMDVAVLGGGIVTPASYIPVAFNGRNAQLQAGQLMGLFPGSKLDLYAAETRDFEKADRIAEAVITGAGLTTAELTVTPLGTHKMSEIQAARARIVSRVYTDQPLRVDLSKMQTHPGLPAISAGLKDLQDSKIIVLAKPGEEWDVRITPTAQAFSPGGIVSAQQTPGTDEWKVTIGGGGGRGGAAEQVLRLRGGDPADAHSISLLRRADGSLLTLPVPVAGQNAETYAQILGDSPQAPLSVVNALTRESRRRLLTQLTGKASRDNTQVEFRIMFCEGKAVGKNTDGTPIYEWARDLSELKPEQDGRYRVRLDNETFFRVELRNKSFQPVYVSILDLSSDGSIGPLWPHPRITGNRLVTFDNSIPADRTNWYQLNDRSGKPALYKFTEPLGEETFMAITTPNQFDLSPMFDPEIARGPVAEARGIQSPLSQLFRSATTRSALASGGVPDDWQAFSMHIEVQPGGGK